MFRKNIQILIQEHLIIEARRKVNWNFLLNRMLGRCLGNLVKHVCKTLCRHWSVNPTWLRHQLNMNRL